MNIIKKVFGDLYYEESMSFYDKGSYQKTSLKKSIQVTEQ